MRRLLCILLSATALYGAQAQTLDQCQQAAERNYPLIQRMDLISKTTELTVSNIQKGWLPQLSASAQATWQSDVTAFPDQMQTLYQQAGIGASHKHFGFEEVGMTTYDVQRLGTYGPG